MTKLNRAVLAGLAATGPLLGAAILAPAQTITVGSWENLVTPPPPDPDPLPNFFHRPIGSAGIDGTHDVESRSVYTSDTYGATNGTKSVKQQINPSDSGGRFTWCFSVQLNETGNVGNFLASGRFAIDVSWRGADWDDADPNDNGWAGINQLAVNGSGQGTDAFTDFGKATTDSWRDAHVPQPDGFRGFWDQSVGDETTTLTWDLTSVVDGNTANNELSVVQAPSGGGFLNIILSTNYKDSFLGTAAFYFDNARLLPRVVASEWQGDAPDSDGDTSNGNAATNLWHASQNWTLGVPGAADSVATFGTNGGLLVGPQTVNTNQSTPIGGIVFNNAAGYTIGGTGSITLDVSTGQASLSVLAGSHTISVPVTLADDTTVSVTPAVSTLTLANLQSSTHAITKSGAGQLTVNNIRAASLTVSGGTVSVSANGTDAGTSKLTSSLTIAAGAALDVGNNDVVIGPGTAKSAVETYVKNARGSGAWTGTGGITSSAARTGPGNTGLGVLSGAEYSSVGGTGTFSGQSYAATDTLVKYTWNGDANFSGTVNLDDYVKIDVGFNTHLTGWLNGDFNYSGAVNFDDYVMIDVAFNTQSGVLRRAVNYLSGDDRSSTGLDDPAVQKVVDHFGEFGTPYASAFLAAVPEPTGMMLFGVGAFARLASRRRRRVATILV